MMHRLRSLLHVPIAALSARSVDETTADALVVDLTSSDAAPSAHAAVRDAVVALSRHVRVFIRVGVASGRLADDLAATLPGRPFGVMLSDVTGPADVEQLGARLRVSEAELGRPDGETRIIPVLGNPAGLLALTGSTWPTARIAAYAWEMPSALGLHRRPDGRMNDVTLLGRSLTLLAASRAGVPLINPLPDTDDADDAFRRVCRAGADEGVSGSMVRNEAQARIANAEFSGERTA